MGRDDAAPAPGLGLAGPAPFERRQELAVQVVARAVRGVRVNIRVGNENPVMRLLWPPGAEAIAKLGHAARRKAPLAFRGRSRHAKRLIAGRGVSVFIAKALSGQSSSFRRGKKQRGPEGGRRSVT